MYMLNGVPYLCVQYIVDRVVSNLKQQATMMRHTSVLRTYALRPQRLAVRTTQRSFAGIPTPKPNEDPHAMAERFVKDSPETRISGQESLESVPLQTKLQNYALATVLLGFVTGVWWYSANAVGRADEVSLVLEAEEARETREVKKQQEEYISDMGAVDQEDGEITLAVAAPDDIASEEEDLNREVLPKSDRPLWKRIIFFWKK
jgi:hypothetical protein